MVEAVFFLAASATPEVMVGDGHEVDAERDECPERCKSGVHWARVHPSKALWRGRECRWENRRD